MHDRMRPLATAGSAAAALLLLVGCASVSAPPTPSATATHSALPAIPTEGYLLAEQTSTLFLSRDAASLATVGIDGVTLLEDAAGVSPLPDASAGLVATAHARQLTAELLLSNYSEALGDFSPKTAKTLLADPAKQQAVAAQLASQVSAGGFDGVQVDLESLEAGDATGLTSFVQTLRSSLDPAKSISLAVMARQSTDEYTQAGYDFTALQSTISRFVLMAYDQHGPTWSKSGPIGGLPWVEDSLDALLKTGVPAGSIDLGVAGYGYTWPGDGSDGTQLSVADARTLAGDLDRYDPIQAEWSATLPDGTVVWWSDAKSLEARHALAVHRQLHGLAVWELSMADPL